MDKVKKEPNNGDIFAIPLFLPSYQKWRESFDEFIDYKKYKFHEEDMYAFGRIIELYCKNVYIMEIFRHVGKIPDNLENIQKSERMFKPLIACGMFERGRWRVLFENPGYDKWRDSDYENISFLYPSHISKGGKSMSISHEQYVELLKKGDISCPTINGPVGIECDIRRVLAEQGIDLNYEQIVEERRAEYPQPRDTDKKLKEMVAPFRWIVAGGTYTLTLEANAINSDCFAEMGALGNGYDWERIAVAYIEKNMPERREKFTFDCEADTFSVQSSAKKALKEFAIAFHKFCLDKEVFEKVLKQSL